MRSLSSNIQGSSNRMWFSAADQAKVYSVRAGIGPGASAGAPDRAIVAAAAGAGLGGLGGEGGPDSAGGSGEASISKTRVADVDPGSAGAKDEAVEGGAADVSAEPCPSPPGPRALDEAGRLGPGLYEHSELATSNQEPPQLTVLVQVSMPSCSRSSPRPMSHFRRKSSPAT